MAPLRRGHLPSLKYSQNNTKDRVANRKTLKSLRTMGYSYVAYPRSCPTLSIAATLSLLICHGHTLTLALKPAQN